VRSTRALFGTLTAHAYPQNWFELGMRRLRVVGIIVPMTEMAKDGASDGGVP
jgi:hypothetical protein